MLALLPEAEQEQRVGVRSVRGPKVGALAVTPKVKELIRDIEYGRMQAPPLVVDQSTLQVVVLDPYKEANLTNWLVYTLGSFSTCPVRWVNLGTDNSRLNTRESTKITQNYLGVLAATLGTNLEEQEEDEDEPLDEEDDFHEELEEEEEPDR